MVKVVVSDDHKLSKPIMKKLYDLVVDILNEYESCRDSDHRLAYLVYNTIDAQFPYIDCIELFSKLENKKLPTMSSIGRARRLAQQNFSELRGKKYNTRQSKGTKKMKGFVKEQTHTDNFTIERTYHNDKLK